MKYISLTLLLAATGFAQPSLDLPRLGCLRDSRQHLRIVYGLRGSFVLSPPVVTQVVTFFCSDALIAAQTPDALIAFDRTGGEIARTQVSARVSFSFDGKILSAQAADTVYQFNGKEWFQSEGVARQPEAPVELGDCAAKLKDGKVTLCGDALPDLPPALSIELIGPDWLHIRTEFGSVAVTRRDGKPETYVLPANVPDAGDEP